MISYYLIQERGPFTSDQQVRFEGDIVQINIYIPFSHLRGVYKDPFLPSLNSSKDIINTPVAYENNTDADIILTLQGESAQTFHINDYGYLQFSNLECTGLTATFRKDIEDSNAFINIIYKVEDN